jgi:hypothetical protein
MDGLCRDYLVIGTNERFEGRVAMSLLLAKDISISPLIPSLAWFEAA